jgi:hypothetical protein
MAKDTAEPGGRSDLRSRLRVPQDGPVDLAAYRTGRTPGAPGGKKETRAETAAMRERIAGLQERLFAQSTAGDPLPARRLRRGRQPQGAARHLTRGRPAQPEQAVRCASCHSHTGQYVAPRVLAGCSVGSPHSTQSATGSAAGEGARVPSGSWVSWGCVTRPP